MCLTLGRIPEGAEVGANGRCFRLEQDFFIAIKFQKPDVNREGNCFPHIARGILHNQGYRYPISQRAKMIEHRIIWQSGGKRGNRHDGIATGLIRSPGVYHGLTGAFRTYPGESGPATGSKIHHRLGQGDSFLHGQTQQLGNHAATQSMRTLGINPVYLNLQRRQVDVFVG